ncbi:MAG TPA: HTTM domain-containing protein [Verrucomicrobiae bacterium]
MATEATIGASSLEECSPALVRSGWLDVCLKRVNEPVDGASLAVFRILFGCVMAFAMVRLLVKGWVRELYLAPAFHFTWEWFPWVKVLPGWGMYGLVAGLALAALGVAAGWRHRFCAALFFSGFTYLELIDQTTYLNHYYLVSLLSGLLIFLPADAKWACAPRREPGGMVPVWAVWLLRFQVGAVFFFAGLAKLNGDWLLEAQPMRIWLAARSDLPWIGPFLAKVWVAYAASWAGALYDLFIPFLLLRSRTRPFACVAVIVFHGMTAVLFNIGMFPWIMMVAALIFFPPEGFGRFLAKGKHPESTGGKRTSTNIRGGQLQRAGLMMLGCYVLIQIALPLRPFLYPQQGAWDGRGFNFSWRVMLVEKTGYVEFFAVSPESRSKERLRVDHLITPRQKVMMAQDPDMIRQMACRLAKDLSASERERVEIHVSSYATINGHPSQRLIRAGIDLTGPLPADWIVPFKAK